ncbi:MAG: Calcineurin-like phosphoesterase [Methanomassiliicoccales archaeon PtaU1.Bin124]|nr:MAG: Calcineurin-like phosphoesterase [Methanomassiliicoccales archaeon PtaU1.Bin124]
MVALALAVLLVVVCYSVAIGQRGDKTATAYTTLDRMIVPTTPIPSTIHPFDVSKFSEYGYGQYKYGAGLGYDLRLDLMSADYSSANITKVSSLLRFFAMTDVHITDEESPAQGVYFGIRENGIISGYSPAMLYSTQMLDAAVQTVNEINKKDSLDFGIFLGDVGNSGQYDELRWFIDTLDGKTINPDSGIKDDPVPGPNNDYQDEFKAAGLDSSIPWYTAIGNHDHFWMGTNPPTEYIEGSYTGSDILKVGDIFAPGGLYRSDFYVGTVDGSTPDGTPIGAGPVNSTSPITVASDPNRRFISIEEWMNEFSNTTSSPSGHGFSGAEPGFACYSFDPNPNVPIRVIVLDDTQSEDDLDIHGYGHGTLDQKRYDWLISELDKGQAEDKLMIVAAHIPIGVQMSGVLGAFMGWSTQAAVSEEALLAKLHTYPNLLMWTSGHRHLNDVTAQYSPDPEHPELGFWVVETPSLREFPQQFRTFEVALNSDNTVSLFVTDVDPIVEGNMLAERSRSYAIAAYQIFKTVIPDQPTGSVSYNAELKKQLTPVMQEKLRAVSSGSSERTGVSNGEGVISIFSQMQSKPADGTYCYPCAVSSFLSLGTASHDMPNINETRFSNLFSMRGHRPSAENRDAILSHGNPLCYQLWWGGVDGVDKTEPPGQNSSTS